MTHRQNKSRRRRGTKASDGSRQVAGKADRSPPSLPSQRLESGLTHHTPTERWVSPSQAPCEGPKGRGKPTQVVSPSPSVFSNLCQQGPMRADKGPKKYVSPHRHD
ncbi:hypothetical protein ACOMHN_001162 [Nucella lapillus]